MRYTACLLLAVTLALVLWDVIAWLYLPAGSTISELVLSASRRYPVLPFAAGLLCGHLFWPQRARR